MTEQEKNIRFDELSERVQIRLGDERVISGPRGSSVGELLSSLEEEYRDAPIVGAIVNRELRELTFAIDIDSEVRPVTMGMADGMRIYRRSLTFLLEAAFRERHPKLHLNVEHSVFAGGYFCQVRDATLSAAELEALEETMRELVSKDFQFKRKQVPIAEAIALFEKRGMTDKVSLLKHRKKDYLVLYELNTHLDYHHGYMLPSSGKLRWFALEALDEGFALRFPHRRNPTELEPMNSESKILDAFRRYGDLLILLGIESVGLLNDAIEEKRIRELILVTEAMHEQRVTDVARQISAQAKDARIVLIAGPSSSGKTTFSKRLSVQLLASGLQPFALEMDRYFVDRDTTPVDEKGEYDFEHIDAVNVERLNNDLQSLIAGKVTRLAHYDFHTGKSGEGDEVQIGPDQIIIIEGIHGLNPDLLPSIPEAQSFRIYLSALTQLNLDSHNRVSTTDTRLVRRIVRDERERGYSPQETIQRWESVRRGEKKYIFPHQGNADIVVNSALVYELAALKPLAEPLLQKVPFASPEHIEVKRLLALLEWFQPLNSKFIPDNSLLREFIGGSILKDFSLWRNGKS
jgi:uridine kinase